MITNITDIIIKDAMMPFLLKCFDNNIENYKITFDIQDNKMIMIIDVLLESYISIKKVFELENIINANHNKSNLYKVNYLFKQKIVNDDLIIKKVDSISQTKLVDNN